MRTTYIAHRVGLLLAALFVFFGIVMIADYGINWDGPYHMVRGQAFARYVLTGKTTYDLQKAYSPLLSRPGEFISRYYFAGADEWQKQKPANLGSRPLIARDYLDKRGDRRVSFYQDNFRDGGYFLSSDVSGHPPFISILSALSNMLFYERLGILGDIESYQLVYLVVSSLGVYAVVRFSFEITKSLWAAVISGLSLGLFPLFLADAHINMKDPLVAGLYATSIWAFWRFILHGNIRWFLAFAVSFALGLGVKWNGIFLPLVLVPWMIISGKKLPKKSPFLFAIAGVAILLFLVLIWPYAWREPLKGIWDLVVFYWQNGTGAPYQPPGFIFFGLNVYPAILLFAQTPDIVLFLAGLGLWSIIRSTRGEYKSTGTLLIIWVLATLGRVMIPGVRTYGGVRQFMEILPALSILAGLGTYFITEVSLKLIKKALEIVVLIGFVLLIITLIKIHPNQNAFFNKGIGGLRGAVGYNLIDWTLTYGNIYKQGIEWLNDHAQTNANLAHVDGGMYAISPLWLRTDISLSSAHFSGFRQKGEYIIALYNPLDPPVFAKRYPERFLKPIHEIRVDGVVLLSIYKNDASNLRAAFSDDQIPGFDSKIVPSAGGDYLEADLGKPYQVTRILARNANPACLTLGTDVIAFLIDRQEKTVDSAHSYVFNEKERLDLGNIQYSFPGQTARYIRIYPQSETSCFASGTIGGIFVLDQNQAL